MKLNIIIPTGNSTALVIEDNTYTNRKKINDKILEKYSEIEQVGFIKRDKPELIMAGGEFCVNATRSAINYYLNNKCGKTKISIPNLNTNIIGGIDKKNYTWLYLNTFRGYRTVYCKLLKQNVIIVTFKGIIHVIVEEKYIYEKTTEQIKEFSLRILKDLDLLKYKASGVVFIKFSDKKIKITPIVYVKKINTLFLETACGSGSAAVAIYEYVVYNKIKCRIKQPSGMHLYTKLFFKKNHKIQKIKISGKVHEIKNL